MSAPPVPPRPPSAQHMHAIPPPPPLPPLPPNFNPYDNGPNGNAGYTSAPHYENPMVAPQPHRLDPSLPAHMAQTLSDQAGPYQQQDYRRPSPAPPPPPQQAGLNYNYNPGFVMPQPNAQPRPGGTPLPNPQGAGWSPWLGSTNTSSSPPMEYTPLTSPAPATPYPPAMSPPEDLSQSMANLTFSSSRPPQHRQPSHHNSYGPPRKSPSPPREQSSLTATLPTIPNLNGAISSIQNPSFNPATKITWCRDVFFLVNHVLQTGDASTSTDPPVGPTEIKDPQLARLVQIAIPIVQQLASTNVPTSSMPPYVSEAIYIRATLAASGAYPEHIPRNPRTAFRDFETAAKGGHHAAWFRLGRDYENFNDVAHARECFERGVKYNVESCVYRMAMAHLMGQLGIQQNLPTAVSMLHRAATMASLDVPQPAYVYALLLLSEFSHISVSASLFLPYIPQGSTAESEARKYLERAAYLHFPAAQYKLGHAYEFAQAPFPYDALLSVQYYSLASQQGEVEADMALSKWFLCGAEGSFEKDETLAFTFAEKAAKKGLPSAEFAMGYYAEVGVGGPKSIELALKWYTKASNHGNNDAKERLAALQQPSPAALSRQEHDNITEAKLIRKRTQAKQRSDAVYQHSNTLPQPVSAQHGRQVIEVIRKNSLAQGPPPSAYQNGPTHSPKPSGAYNRMPGLPEQSPTPPQQSPNLPPSAGATPRPRPQKAQQYPAQHRYTLTDPGAASAGRPTPPQQQQAPPPQMPQQQQLQGQFRPPGHRVGSVPSGGPGSQHQSPPPGGPPQMQRPPAQGGGGPSKKPGPATFAEMGFQGAKAEDKECVIM